MNKYIQKLFCEQMIVGTPISYINGSIFAGLVAMGLIVGGSITITSHPIYSTLMIIYAFGILLPLSYYQRKMADEEMLKT